MSSYEPGVHADTETFTSIKHSTSNTSKGDLGKFAVHPNNDQISDTDSEELEFSDALETNDSLICNEKVIDVKCKRNGVNNDSPSKSRVNDILEQGDCDLSLKNNIEKLSALERTEKKNEDIQSRKEAENQLSEETKLERLRESTRIKTSANNHYVNGQYQDAISSYTAALNLCPLCFSKDRAVFFSNRAAAKFKQNDTTGAVEDCCDAILLDSNYVKAILRRARIYEETDKPHESLKDYERILELDPKHVESIVAVKTRLPEKVKDKEETMKAEMMDGLKKLGNMCLKPFGLSTDNFKFVQDPNTGGYSVNLKK